MRYPCGIHFLISSKSVFFAAIWLNVYSWSWFEARDQCRSKGRTIRETSNLNTSFWTKYYTRRSHWMATLGCSLGVPFDKISFDTDIRITKKSKGICQELCIEHFGSNKSFLFALKNKTCICVKDDSTLMNLNLDTCKTDCIDDNKASKGCGEKFTVYLSKPVSGKENSSLNSSCFAVDCNRTCSAECQLKNRYNCKRMCPESENVFTKNRIQSCCFQSRDSCFQSLMNESRGTTNCQLNSSKTWIVFKRQTYLSSDRGSLQITDFEKINIIISCQQCKNRGCQYIDCNSSNDARDILCSNEVAITNSPFTPTSATQNKTLFIMSKVTGTEKSYKVLGTTVKQEIGDIENKDDTISVVGIVAASLVICSFFLSGAFYIICIRKKKTLKCEDPITPQLMDYTRERKEQSGLSVAECLYELADNTKFGANYSQIQEHEELYHHLSETVPRNDVNDDTYMIAGYKTKDKENVYFHGMDDPYNHLRETYRTRHNDDTYDHMSLTTPAPLMD